MFSVRTLTSGEYLYDGSARTTWRPSPHVWKGFSGSNRRRFLIMHYTGGSSGGSSVEWFQNPASKVCAHITIDRDGTVWQCASFTDRAWHCGASSWRDRNGVLHSGINNHSIGIELANSGACRKTAAGHWRNGLGVRVAAEDVVEAEHKSGAVYFGTNSAGVPTGFVARPGWEVFPAIQIQVAVAVARALIDHYGLEQIVGHDDISPGRKVDPGPMFDMADFRSQVAGGGSESSGLFRVRPGTLDGLAIRKGPSKDAQKVREANLAVGTRVEMMHADGVWWHVRVLAADDSYLLDGWVHSAYLVPD